MNESGNQIVEVAALRLVVEGAASGIHGAETMIATLIESPTSTHEARVVASLLTAFAADAAVRWT